MAKIIRFLIPFAIMGVIFIIVGFALSNEPVIYFGIVWLIVALVVYVGNMARRP